MNEALKAKLKVVQSRLREFQRVIVAFSGGVDSTLMAKIALDILGKKNVTVVTADSPSMARQDLQDAVHLAQYLGVDHRIISTEEIKNRDYQSNNSQRCYICKQTLFKEIEILASQMNIRFVIYGAIGDDHAEWRPGQLAAREQGVHAPLQEAGLIKDQVRELARAFALPNWDKPQNACLASRIPHGTIVSENILKQIEQAEARIQSLGFRQVRVRYYGTTARIEVEPEAVDRLQHPQCIKIVESDLKQLGFEKIVIDPRGYRSGGANISEKNLLVRSDKQQVTGDI